MEVSWNLILIVLFILKIILKSLSFYQKEMVAILFIILWAHGVVENQS